MRRLVLIVPLLALALPGAARAADLTAVPRDFSPDAKRLTVHAELPAAERVGVQLATTAGQTGRLDRRAAAAPLPDAALERPPRRRRGV